MTYAHVNDSAGKKYLIGADSQDSPELKSQSSKKNLYNTSFLQPSARSNINNHTRNQSHGVHMTSYDVALGSEHLTLMKTHF